MMMGLTKRSTMTPPARLSLLTAGLATLSWALAACTTTVASGAEPHVQRDPRTPRAAPSGNLSASRLEPPPGARSRPQRPPPPYRGDASKPRAPFPIVPPSLDGVLLEAELSVEPQP